MTPFLLAATLFSAEPRVTEVKFLEDDVIGADLHTPDGAVVTTTQRPDFEPLIKVRENFNDKIAKEKLP